MSVRDFMSTNVITVPPETKISVAVNLMKSNNIHRLPVIDNGHLVGLITAGIIQAASPSQATSLSIYEYNYLLNKMTVKEIMETTVRTIGADDFLEDAIYKMLKYQVGVLPVISNNETIGIITNNDILKAFLDVTDYKESATVVQVFIHQDRTGVIYEIGKIMADNNLNIQTLMVTHQGTIKVVEIHVDRKDGLSVASKLREAGFDAKEATHYKHVT
ncbi:CBS and ACT domain-containing protein [Lentilactobacillus hilgardii]|uniref:CBS domain protein n=1 Tax=Lentilactobacillus hilgardii (strain ATCC 8290 / DSM 20176 / CCUG 30140 / JCM 1155 / KCTC 3500 / NBRC 15886 / NCIMB 8040 / NRRL B-1843 / 9) TaxID=1423757 RepID=C0XJD7_LENH9|nr:CBS and ACT domain-containing protein [Lentilactobacillus hilgardii]EEI24523.1 CBS domain protein [Lentilactobacillus hilgardii DSM 20176 = ATCC 8290]MCP9334230.1 CBS domain-containing protein [Lentilactobacillus hilgardii]MCP9350754.1 CBS domain-containing protein [Lentilactobacillus hilgardii]MCP9353633.1 CBS domain-containing protein [Lentilactobacillus hilgardii]QEU37707.1 CBS domain-containing protein [Lentilactobacillus hilgardii]